MLYFRIEELAPNKFQVYYRDFFRYKLFTEEIFSSDEEALEMLVDRFGDKYIAMVEHCHV